MGTLSHPTDGPEKVALIHDFLVSLRGADRVFLEMTKIWPDADLFTPIYDPEGTRGQFSDRNVHTSFLQKLHPSAKTFRAFLPLYPTAIESFDLAGYDVVVSSSSAWAHAAICDESAVHVCYCHNPFRYAWNERSRTLTERFDPVTRAVLRSFFRRWREWDWIAAQRVDTYLTNSELTQARIKAYFGRQSDVVYPPVELDRFVPSDHLESHYLVLSELVTHKAIDDAVRAFTKIGKPLVVAGDGPDLKRLQTLAGPTIEFAGRVSDAEAARLMATCQAFIQTSVEEFGIASVEAQSAGRPVIARHAGGALETVIDGKTGVYWNGGPNELAAAVESFDPQSVDPEACRENAQQFHPDRFRQSLLKAVERAQRGDTDRDMDSRHIEGRFPRFNRQNLWGPTAGVPRRRR